MVASHNSGKLREIAELVSSFDLVARPASQWGLSEPEETGTSFEENAYIKAQAAAVGTGLVALADDSGLCVDALDGAPGVYTADWATQADGSRDFASAMRRLEDRLRQADPAAGRGGRFVSVLCLAWPDGYAEYFRGEIEGQLVWPPRGDLGFGFDPVFVPEGHEVTFGQMPPERKHGWKPGQPDALSHRARAFQKFARACLGVS